jgi:hypothetical protein
MARASETSKTRAILIEMAQVWQRLADEGVAAAEMVQESRPVVQQQQQIQPKNDEE